MAGSLLSFDEALALVRCGPDPQAFLDLAVAALLLDDGQLDALDRALDAWPDDARIATSEWNGGERRDFPFVEPVLRLARGLHVTDPRDAAWMGQLLATPGIERQRSLHFHGTGLTEEGLQLLCHDSRLALRELTLTYELEPLLLAIIAGAPALASLRRLALWDCGEIDDAAVEALAGSPHMTNLELLQLVYLGLGDRAARALAASPYIRGLRNLSLDTNHVRDDGAVALATSGNFDGLEELWLGANNIGGKGLLAVATSPHLAKLEVLNARWSRGLEDDGRADEVARALAASTTLPRLRVLNLDGLPCGDDALRLLEEAARSRNFVLQCER